MIQYQHNDQCGNNEEKGERVMSIILTVISDVDCCKLKSKHPWLREKDCDSLVEDWRKFPNRSKKGSLCLNVYPTFTDIGRY